MTKATFVHDDGWVVVALWAMAGHKRLRRRVRAHGDVAVTIKLRNGHIRSSSAPSWQFGSLTGCGRFCLRLMGGAGGNGLVTATALPAAAATFFLALARVLRVGAAAARGAAALGSVAIMTSQQVAATAAALVAAAAPFLVAAVVAVAADVAAAAVRAAEAAFSA